MKKMVTGIVLLALVCGVTYAGVSKRARTELPPVSPYVASPEVIDKWFWKDANTERWATGGVCDTSIDCALTSMLFCNQHGGVVISIHDAGDPTGEEGCLTWCADGTRNKVECSPAEEEGITVSDTEADPNPIGDECHPDFIGPPNPDNLCPCDGEECT